MVERLRILNTINIKIAISGILNTINIKIGILEIIDLGRFYKYLLNYQHKPDGLHYPDR